MSKPMTIVLILALLVVFTLLAVGLLRSPTDQHFSQRQVERAERDSIQEQPSANPDLANAEHSLREVRPSTVEISEPQKRTKVSPRRGEAPQLRVKGRTLDISGSAVENAAITSKNPFTTEFSDDEGSFLIHVTPVESNYSLLVTHGSYQPQVVTIPVNPKTVESVVDITLESGATICVDVRSDDGSTVSGALVRMWSGPPNAAEGVFVGSPEDQLQLDRYVQFESQRVATATTSLEGLACVRGLEEGVYQLSVFASGFSPSRLGAVKIAPNQHVEWGEVILSRGKQVEGHVLDCEHKPIANVAVEVFAGHEYLRATTAHDGHYVCGGLSPDADELELRAVAEGLGVHWARKVPATETLPDIVLCPGTLSLEVVDGDARPVVGVARVELDFSTTGGALNPYHGVESTVLVELDENGRGRVDQVPSSLGHMEVSVQGIGSRRLELTPADRTEPYLRVELPDYEGVAIVSDGSMPLAEVSGLLELAFETRSGNAMRVKRINLGNGDGNGRLDPMYLPMEADVHIVFEWQGRQSSRVSLKGAFQDPVASVDLRGVTWSD